MRVFIIRTQWQDEGQVGSDLTAFDNEYDATEWLKDELSEPGTKAQLKSIEVDFD